MSRYVHLALVASLFAFVLTLTTASYAQAATVELDKDLYTWTDKVFITVVSPVHNLDSNVIDKIGSTDVDKVVISTRGNRLSNYKLVETGPDTGIFTGKVILTGFCHDADGDTSTGVGTTCPAGSDTNPRTQGTGPTDGFIAAGNDDGLTVAFKVIEDETVVDSALIRWNIGEISWLETSYPPDGQGTCQIVDRDMNFDPNAINTFQTSVWSDTDLAGVLITMTETEEDTGIFDGTVYFTNSISSDNRLHVVGEETATCEYNERTLPSPHTISDNLRIYATTSITGPKEDTPLLPTIELNSKVYTWTDKVLITVVSPEHNLDSNLIDEIRNNTADADKIQVATRGAKLASYKLVETGLDTGTFTGEVTLTGFASHDADGDGNIGDATGFIGGTGPTDGLMPARDSDGISASFETENQVVTASSLIQWNIGKISWLEASYQATGQGVIRVVEPDMNLNPKAIDDVNVSVWSDSDSGGIDIKATETGDATGIFEGAVFFVAGESSGSQLHVEESNTVTGEYEDRTLPSPYNQADELEITTTTLIKSSSTLAPAKDSYLRQRSDDSNQGINPLLQIKTDATNRVVIAFDQDSIASSAEGRTLQSATLRLHINDMGNNWKTSGRTVEVHRLLSDWVEGNGWSVGNTIRGTGTGVTWNCAADTNIANTGRDCATKWKGGNFVSAPTDSVLVKNGMAGQWIEFDVKSDVDAFLSGTPNYGWIIKKTNEKLYGTARFDSREAATNNPELVLVFGSSS